MIRRNSIVVCKSQPTNLEQMYMNLLGLRPKYIFRKCIICKTCSEEKEPPSAAAVAPQYSMHTQVHKCDYVCVTHGYYNGKGMSFMAHGSYTSAFTTETYIIQRIYLCCDNRNSACCGSWPSTSAPIHCSCALCPAFISHMGTIWLERQWRTHSQPHQRHTIINQYYFSLFPRYRYILPMLSRIPSTAVAHIKCTCIEMFCCFVPLSSIFFPSRSRIFLSLVPLLPCMEFMAWTILEYDYTMPISLSLSPLPRTTAQYLHVMQMMVFLTFFHSLFLVFPKCYRCIFWQIRRLRAFIYKIE